MLFAAVFPVPIALITVASPVQCRRRRKPFKLVLNCCHLRYAAAWVFRPGIVPWIMGLCESDGNNYCIHIHVYSDLDGATCVFQCHLHHRAASKCLHCFNVSLFVTTI
jgi:hypothetical protein